MRTWGFPKLVFGADSQKTKEKSDVIKLKTMPAFFTNPSLLTKDRLKAELEANGIPLPRSDQKKDFYVNLYLQRLTSQNKTNSPGKPDFYSSDEEESTPRRRSIKKPPPKKYKSPKREKDLPFDVLALSDGDLARQLRVLGATVGPITDSTRPVYQKKLAHLLTEEAQNPPSTSVPARSKNASLPKNASPPRKHHEPEEYSADEKEESGDAAEDNEQEEDMEVDENSVDEKDEPDAMPVQQINRNSFARKRYVPPKSVPEPEPLPAPTRRSLRNRAGREDVVMTTVTRKEVNGQQEKPQVDDGDGFASTLKFVLFAIAAMLLLVLMVYVVMEGNPPDPEKHIEGSQTNPPQST